MGPVWEHVYVYRSKLSRRMGGSRLDSALGGPCRSLLFRCSKGGHGHEFLDFLQPTISTFYMAVQSESAGVEYLCQIVKLHTHPPQKRSFELHWSSVVTQLGRYVAGDASQIRLVPKRMEDGAPDPRMVNSSSGGDGKWAGVEDRWDLVGFAPYDTALCDSSEFTTAIRGLAVPKETGGWHHLTLLPSHCDICQKSSIYWSGLSRAPFTPEAGIRLQTARDATVFLVDPTETATTENGICADVLETLVLPMLTRSPFPSIF